MLQKHADDRSMLSRHAAQQHMGWMPRPVQASSSAGIGGDRPAGSIPSNRGALNHHQQRPSGLQQPGSWYLLLLCPSVSEVVCLVSAVRSLV